jgi:poly(3-hydroxybutyrate) depolymerase
MTMRQSVLLRRRRFVQFGAAPLVGGAFGMAAAHAALRERTRYAVGMVLDFLYARFGPQPALRAAHEHPMHYLLSLPRRAPDEPNMCPWAIVLTIDGSDRDFHWNHAAFVRARGDRPFVIVTPFVLSNGGHPKAASYPYSAAVFRAAATDPLAFDLTGVAAVLRDVKGRIGSDDAGGPPVYLAGFSAGGHLTWALALAHPHWFAAVAPASANFAGRGIDPVSTVSTVSALPAGVCLPIRAFQGDRDGIGAALTRQWAAARGVASRRGFKNLSRVMVPGAGHSPFAGPVLAFFDEVRTRAAALLTRGTEAPCVSFDAMALPLRRRLDCERAALESSLDVGPRW